MNNIFSFYNTLEKRFEWNFEAKDFERLLKQKSKEKKWTPDCISFQHEHFGKIITKILPETKFISTVKHNESRVVGYWVRWFYTHKKERFFGQ